MVERTKEYKKKANQAEPLNLLDNLLQAVAYGVCMQDIYTLCDMTGGSDLREWSGSIELSKRAHTNRSHYIIYIYIYW